MKYPFILFFRYDKYCHIDNLLKDGFSAKNPIANNWKDIRDYLYKL